MLAVTTATLPAETEAWAAEIKWDGYRALCLHDHQGGGRWGQRQALEPALVFVRPELAVQVRFLGWEAGRLRHPAYRGVA